MSTARNWWYTAQAATSVALLLSSNGCSVSIGPEDDVSRRSEAVHSIHPGWQDVEITTSIAQQLRQPVVDVLYMGAKRFVVPYIEIEPECDGLTCTKGELRYRRYDVDTDLKSDPEGIPLGRGDMTRWVRVMAGGPIVQGDCDVGFYAFWNDDPYGWNAGVRIQRHRWCSGDFESDTILSTVGGVRPSVAAFEDSEWKLFLVYGRESALYGRFFDMEGSPLSDEIMIADVSNPEWEVEIFSTDVHWNAVADRFIVGFVHKEVNYGEPCIVENVQVDISGNVIAPPVQQGACRGHFQGGPGGHHTSVAYDSRMNINPNGLYAWWFTDMEATHRLQLMGSDGMPAGNPVIHMNTTPAPSGDGWIFNSATLPVAPRRDQTVPITKSYVTHDMIGNGQQQLMSFRSLGSDILYHEDVASEVTGWPMAAGTLESDTVVVSWNCYRGAAPVECPSGSSLVLSVLGH